MTAAASPRSASSARETPATAWSDALTPALLAGFGGVIVVLVVALIIGLTNLRKLHAASDAVEQSYSVKLTLQRILNEMVDAETGERGFIITNLPAYLDPYNRAREMIAAEFSTIRGLTSSNRDQQADLDLLSSAVMLKLQELAEAIRLRQESGFAAAQAQVASNIGKHTMDDIRTIIARMEAREDVVLAARTAQAAESYRTALWTRIMTTGLALLALVGLFVGTMRYGAMRLRATRTAEAQEAALRESLHQRDDFVALVSHELRTPANTIVGWGRMLSDGTMRADRVEQAVRALTRSAESIRQLVEDLMDTNLAASGRMRLNIGLVDLKEIVQDAVDTVRPGADNKGVVLTVAIDSDVPSMRGDGARLKQVVWNLLSNAIKFTPTGGHVTVALTAAEGGLRLEVHDTGEGIDPSFLPRVFERYQQALSPRSQPGLGLGLAIVRHLVELHGGTVTAHSTGRGQGATFVIEVPIALEREAMAAPSHIGQV